MGVIEEVTGAIIVGAGPSGIATVACLKMLGIPTILIEKEACIAHFWKNKTYDRLQLHIAKEYCELPFMPFPPSYPTFVTRKQFIQYLEDYATKFEISPRFCQTVIDANFIAGKWHVKCSGKKDDEEVEYVLVAKWLVVATGENAEPVKPSITGLEAFNGKVLHSSEYKNGHVFEGQKVLVVGCGNSGMEIALDLFNSNAKPSLAVRSSVHILPRVILGKSMFSVATILMRFFSIQAVDYLLLFYSRLRIGNTSSYGIERPSEGPLELKMKTGKTPVLDVGTLAKIRSGDIKVFPNIEQVVSTSKVRFVNNIVEEFDTIILATGYRSNVPHWLKHDGELFSENGLPKTPFPNNWKGNNGLYAAGLSKRGLLGCSTDAKLIAQDIKDIYDKDVTK
ncbi:hypothetical protein SUGI_0904410 [Cryptomeria japonica]|nr:hypothetical protein SUGI_0904410 [Cryptomeria japonica]